MSARLAACIAAALVCGCAPSARQLKLSAKPDVELRAMQTRVFGGADRTQLLDATIAGLLDRGYSIDKVDVPTGTVTAVKANALHITGTVQQEGRSAALRCDATIAVGRDDTQVDAPEFYRNDCFQPVAAALLLSHA